MIPKFVFGGSTGKSYEELKKEQEAYLRALAQRQIVTDPVAAATYLGSQLHNLFMSALLGKQLADMDRQGAALFSDLMKQITGDAAPAPSQERSAMPQAAQPPAGAGAGAGGSVTGKLPRGIRNNNPGNIEYGKFAQAAGAVGSDGRFARFKTLDDGLRAMHRLLLSYQRRGYNTLRKIISRWSPPSENDTSSYIARVAKMTGLDPDQPLDVRDPAVAARIIHAMTIVENGRPFFGVDRVMQALGGVGSSATLREVADKTGTDARVMSAALGVPEDRPLNMDDPVTNTLVAEQVQRQHKAADLTGMLQRIDQLPPPPPPPKITPPEERERALARFVRILERVETSPVLSPERKDALKLALQQKIEALKARYAQEDLQLKQWHELRKKYYETKIDLRRKVAEELLKARLNPMTVGPGSVVYDPITRQPLFRAPEATTEDERMLAEINARRAAQGLPPLTLFELKKELAAAGATKVNVNTAEAQDQIIRKKLLEGEAKQLAAIREQAAEAADIRQQLQILRELLPAVQQGAVSGHIQQLLGELGFSAPADAFLRITRSLLPRLRTPGMGALSDSDIKLLEAKLPALTSRPEVNELMLRVLERGYDLVLQRKQVVDDYLEGKITTAEMRRRLKELDKPLLTEDERRILERIKTPPGSGIIPPAAAAEQPPLRKPQPPQQRRVNARSEPVIRSRPIDDVPESVKRLLDPDELMELAR